MKHLLKIDRPSWKALELRNSKIKEGFLALDRNENQDSILRDEITSILMFKIPLHKITSYTDYYDTYQLLSKYYDQPTYNMLITGGCDEAMRLTFEALLDKDQVIGYKMPTYQGVVNNSADLTEQHVDYLSDHPAVWYICSPNNPDGKVTTPAEVERMLINHPKTMFFLDNTYNDFCDYNFDHLIRYTNIVIGKSFSKGWGLAGARFGVMLSHKTNIEQIAKIRPIMSVSSITLHLINYLLENPHHIEESIQRNREGIEYAHQYFDGVLNEPHINHVEIPWTEELAVKLTNKKILFNHTQPYNDYGNIKLTTLPVKQFKDILE